MRCSVRRSTGGSVYNVNTIKAGELDFNCAQSDTAYQAFKGEGKLKAITFRALVVRLLFTLNFSACRQSKIRHQNDGRS